MDIISIKHKGLARLVEQDDSKDIGPDLQKRVKNIVAALVSAKDMEGVSGPPGWKIHRLKGDRDGAISISASGNWRITFEIIDDQIHNLDLEDYH